MVSQTISFDYAKKAASILCEKRESRIRTTCGQWMWIGAVNLAIFKKSAVIFSLSDHDFCRSLYICQCFWDIFTRCIPHFIFTAISSEPRFASCRLILILCLFWKRAFVSNCCTFLVTFSALTLLVGRQAPPFPQIDIIRAVVIVWRVRGKTIRSVLCNNVCNNCAQCNAHTYEQT